MSSTERNKVKSFGDPSIAHGEMADRFLIVGAFNAPPVTNRVKLISTHLFDFLTYYILTLFETGGGPLMPPLPRISLPFSHDQC